MARNIFNEIYSKRLFHTVGDFADRFTHTISFIIFIILAIYVASRPSPPTPEPPKINCMLPKQFGETPSWGLYSEQYCLAQLRGGKAFEVLADDSPQDSSVERSRRINFSDIGSNKTQFPQQNAQIAAWIPVILVLTALLFRLPGIVWRFLGSMTPVPVPQLVAGANEASFLEGDARKRAFDRLAGRVSQKGRLPVQIAAICVYGLVKIMYVVLWMLLFYRMQCFVGVGYDYGSRVMEKMHNGPFVEAAEQIDIDFQCDLALRRLGNINRFSIQCFYSSMGNYHYGDQYLLFIWAWLQIGMVLSWLSLAYWMLVMALPFCHTCFVKPYAEAASAELSFGELGKLPTEKFALGYIKQDGVFFLRMVRDNVGEVPTQEIVGSLWSRFQNSSELTKMQD